MVPQVLAAVTEWAGARFIRGLALVGSYARGQAGPDSDVDLILLVDDPHFFRVDTTWLTEIAWDRTGVRPAEWKDAQYGSVWSRHVLLDNGLEVEFSFASLSWADTAPVDAGTQGVVTGGCRILYDPGAILAALCTEAGGAGSSWSP